MPAKVDDHWKDSLISLKVNNPSWGGVRLLQALQAEAKAGGRSDAPSQGWVSGWLRTEWPKVTDAERQGHRSFYWPESMERGDLPWEASASALELLHFLDQAVPGPTVPGGNPFLHYLYDGYLRPRPPARFVKWFWRVSQAVPERYERVMADGTPEIQAGWMYGRLLAAGLFTASENSGRRTSLPGIEWWLAYRPWESVARFDAYRVAQSRQVDPIPHLPSVSDIVGGSESRDAELLSWLRGFFSFHLGIRIVNLKDFKDYLEKWLGLSLDAVGDSKKGDEGNG